MLDYGGFTLQSSILLLIYSRQMTNKQQTVVDLICEDIAEGYSQRSACLKHNIDESTFRLWKRDSESINTQYTRARRDRASGWAEGMIDLAKSIDITGDPVQVKAQIDLLKIEVDARKWIIARIDKDYGDKMIHSGDSEAPIEMVVRRVGSKE